MHILVFTNIKHAISLLKGKHAYTISLSAIIKGLFDRGPSLILNVCTKYFQTMPLKNEVFLRSLLVLDKENQKLHAALAQLSIHGL